MDLSSYKRKTEGGDSCTNAVRSSGHRPPADDGPNRARHALPNSRYGFGAVVSRAGGDVA